MVTAIWVGRRNRRAHESWAGLGDKIRVNLHRGKIEDASFALVIEHTDGTKLQVDVVGLDLTALIDTRQVVEWEAKR